MMDSIAYCLIAIPALPLAAAIVTAVFGPRWLKNYSHWPTILALIAAFGCSLVLVREVNHHQGSASSDESRGFERIVPLWIWADIPKAYHPSSTVRAADGKSIADSGWRDLRVDVVLRADGLTAMMLAMVTFVASLVAIFAAGYMHGDRSYWRFFSYVSLFVFSMTMLVSVSNFVMLYVFWEAVGVCSYLLIGFWYEKPEAAAAGKKAFLVNRIGDFGFALALFLIWTTYGTLNFHDSLADGTVDSAVVASAAKNPVVDTNGNATNPVVTGVLAMSRISANAYVGGGVALAICLLLMLGACGKSAQFPLHVWLPDAMEGPTPVSALIHAATMVTAGVYMVTRCAPLFMASPEAQLIVACIGALTALLAGAIALTQFDLKRVLAYSTVSQLGLMFVGLGAGTFAGISAGMFHLFTHAFFKALLFLGAGSVMHAMGNVIDMRQFGGLRQIMPTTHATFLVGCLALAGIFPFAGFWSKDAIVAAVEAKAHGANHETHHPDANEEPTRDRQETRSAAGPVTSLTHSRVASDQRFAAVYQGLYYAVMLTSFLTACYTFRAFFLTFYGPRRIPQEAGHHAHESPVVMWLPLAVLAIGAGVAGFAFDRTFLSTPTHVFAEFIGNTPSLAGGLVAATKTPYEFHWSVAITSSVVAIAGLAVSTYVYLVDRRVASWLRSFLDFEFATRWLDVESVSRWKNEPWVAGVHRFASRLGWGRVTSAIGHIILLIVLVLATPFLLGHYVSPYKLSQKKFLFDEIYQLVIVTPLRFLAEACYAVDRWIVDGTVNTVGRLPPLLGALMRSLQMGLVQFYALAMLLGVIILFATRWMMS